MIFLIFNSDTQVLNSEDILIDNYYDVEIISVPKEVNNNCGLAIIIQKENLNNILQLLIANNLNPKEIYEKIGSEYFKIQNSD